MKRIFLFILVGLSFYSCSIDKDENFNLEIVPISSVEMPTSYSVDSVSQISVFYNSPSTCYQFSNFYYNAIGNERTVAVYCKRYDNQNCTLDVPNAASAPLNFKPKAAGTYHFRFWSGVNSEGVDQYIEQEVVVNN